MTEPVTFEIAKLLKEKKYNLYHQLSYWEGNLTYTTPGYPLDDGTTSQDNYWDFERYYAPTIAELVMWLYEKHGVWINVSLYEVYDNVKFYFVIIQVEKIKLYKNKKSILGSGVKYEMFDFNSPTESYLAAIEYTLNNLIK